METWNEFREKFSIKNSGRHEVLNEIEKWAENYRRKIVKHEPADAISRGEFIILDDLLKKINEMY